MSLISWSPSLSVGVARFDTEHQKLIEMINQLHDGMKSGQSKETLATILNSLIEYTGTHFAAEETLMQSHQYMQFSTHKAEHTKLVQKVLQLQKDFVAGKMMLSMEVMTFLKDWLNTHIMGTDQKYTAFFNEKGVV